MSTCISDADWEQFLEDGFLRIENVLSKVELEALIKRIDDIMMGKIQYGDKLLMQLDPTTNKNGEELDYEKQNVEISGQTVGWKGATRMYRKIGEAGAGLECDDLFASFMKKSIFRDICSRAYGPHTKISVYRAMLFNKPAHFKKYGGDWWALDRDPKIFCWTALDDVTENSGCMKVIRGSHKFGLLSARGHTLKKICRPENTVSLQCKPGDTFLVHNFTVHKSGSNVTACPRRAFSVNYIDGRTQCLDPKYVNNHNHQF
eukprot:GSMAST32.ASY1.ANO1.1860.1 assembled CDS